MNEQIQQVIEMVKNAAPVMWHAAYRQVYLDGAEDIFMMLLFLVAGVQLLQWSRKEAIEQGTAEKPDYIGSPPTFFSALFGLLGLIAATGSLIAAIDNFGNPTLAAIKILTHLARLYP